MWTLFGKKRLNVIHKSAKTYLKYYFGREEPIELHLMVW